MFLSNRYYGSVKVPRRSDRVIQVASQGPIRDRLTCALTLLRMTASKFEVLLRNVRTALFRRVLPRVHFWPKADPASGVASLEFAPRFKSPRVFNLVEGQFSGCIPPLGRQAVNRLLRSAEPVGVIVPN